MKTAQAAALMVTALVVACNHHAEGGDAGATPAPSATPSAPPAVAAKSGELPALTDFEGEVDLVATSAKSATPVPLNLLVKSETIRVDVPDDALAAPEARSFTGGGKVYAIIKPTEKKTIVVLDGKREAVTLDLDTLADRAKSFKQHAPGGADKATETPPKVVKTSKKEMVAGYACTDWEVTNADHSKLDLCVAEKAASFFHFPSLAGIPTEHAWALELVDGTHFPLKGVSFGKDGAENGRVEVTKIDKHTLDAAMFEVPAGYKQVTIDELLQGLGGGGIPGDIPRGPHGGPHGHHHKQH
jgi:hypothetical protein